MKREKLKLSTILSYALATGSGYQIMGSLVGAYLMIFLTDTFGVPAGAVGVITVVASVWDAINDPMMGTIVSVEDGQLTMHRQDNGFDEDVIITIAEDTKVLDAENGYPVELGDLKEGNTISAYVDEAMTLSLPPITNGLLILVQAEGYDFPRYTKVKELMAANTEGERILTAEKGINYMITAETRLLPYLTRNIVSEEDLTEGTEILIWNEENGNKAEKIVVFQGENGYAK